MDEAGDREQRQIDRGGDGPRRLITLGRITGPFGVHGWVKVHSETDPRENIVRYSTWYLGDDDWPLPREVDKGRRHGKGVIAKLVGCDDRDAAEQLRGLTIAVRRDQLADRLQAGEYYWTDLEGLAVVTVGGVELGRIDHLFETGSNDVMVVRGERERLIPYLWQQVVLEVDLAARRMRVDWDPEF